LTRIVVIPDTQMPYDNRRAVAGIINYIGRAQPDAVIHIGDLMDYPTPSRWSKGSAEEFAKQMVKDNDDAKRRLFDPLRAVYDGPVGVHEGNHDLRPRTYLTRYAPALAEYEDQFHISELLDFHGFGIDALPAFNKIGRGWVTTHGHLGSIALSKVGGATAANATDKIGMSVVMGHTHRQGIIPRTKGYGGKSTSILTGVEVGHMMDQTRAHYLKGGTGNWQMGFATLDVVHSHVQPTIVRMTAGRFVVDGEVWEY
jgi:predicted phosphodiesterase